MTPDDAQTTKESKSNCQPPSDGVVSQKRIRASTADHVPFIRKRRLGSNCNSTEDRGGQTSAPSPDEIRIYEDLQRYLGSDPSSQTTLDYERMHVLDSAVCSAKQMLMSGQDPEHDIVPANNLEDDSAFPNVEFVYLMLNRNIPHTLHYTLLGAHRCLGVEDPSSSASGWLKFHANTPSAQLEAMAFALLQHEVSGDRRLQYIICVNWVAYAYLTTYQSEAKSAAMRQAASNMKHTYRDNVLAAIAHLDTTIRPDPVFLQSILSGVGLPSHSSVFGTKSSKTNTHKHD